MSFGRANQQWCTFSRLWYLVNADRQPPGGLATLIAKYLQGVHKPIYHALSDVGDHVVVINSKSVAYSGNKWEQKMFHSHTGRKKGRLRMTAAQVHQIDQSWIMRRMVYQQLPNSGLRRTQFQRLHVFEDDNVPNELMENISGVLTPPRRIPKGLSDYTQEEIDAFPKLFSKDNFFLKR
ncbi:large ribosomal subunit protein uL13m-like [Clavelina lepadiformis]|uniref:39S ribosomal protein L13, mitochondrial n=1 Tax=Clavelina lepadiformis TaxID=159417 RepID=A0ABP0GHE7_CLALP